ncbi:hypothetical protein MKX01_011689, partial [Papaver californicum]
TVSVGELERNMPFLLVVVVVYQVKPISTWWRRTKTKKCLAIFFCIRSVVEGSLSGHSVIVDGWAQYCDGIEAHRLA